MTGYFHIENIKVETAAQIKHKKCDSLRKIASLQRMAGKSAPEVHWGLIKWFLIRINECIAFQPNAPPSFTVT